MRVRAVVLPKKGSFSFVVEPRLALNEREVVLHCVCPLRLVVCLANSTVVMWRLSKVSPYHTHSYYMSRRGVHQINHA